MGVFHILKNKDPHVGLNEYPCSFVPDTDRVHFVLDTSVKYTIVNDSRHVWGYKPTHAEFKSWVRGLIVGPARSHFNHPSVERSIQTLHHFRSYIVSTNIWYEKSNDINSYTTTTKGSVPCFVFENDTLLKTQERLLDFALQGILRIRCISVTSHIYFHAGRTRTQQRRSNVHIRPCV